MADRTLDASQTPLTPLIREAICAHYGGVCQYCDALGAAEVDHIIPKHHGGTNTLGNATLSCRRCNSMKGSLLLTPLFGAIAHTRAHSFAPRIVELARHMRPAIVRAGAVARGAAPQAHATTGTIPEAFRGFMRAHRETRFTEPGEEVAAPLTRAGWRWSARGKTTFGLLPGVLTQEIARPLHYGPKEALRELARAGLILTSQEAGEERFATKGPLELNRVRLVMEAAQ